MKPPRFLAAKDRPRTIDEDGNRRCRSCGNILTGRRTSFCHDLCVHNYRLRADRTYAVQQVFLRDRGVCKACGCDTEQLREDMGKLPQAAREARAQALGISLHRVRLTSNRRLPRLWDLDHSVRVADGGGSCGIDNLATLCLPCHQAKSRKERRTGSGKIR